MNKYDDIKQFKEKIDMHDIDYKEISDDESQNGAHTWPLIMQLASQGNDSPLENGRTPQPVSAHEFAESARAETPSASPEPSPLNHVAPPDNGPVAIKRPLSHSLFPAPPEPVALAKSIIPGPAISSVTAPSVTTIEHPAPGHQTEFRHIFSPKGAQTHSTEFGASSRDIPLQTLLESIALCR